MKWMLVAVAVITVTALIATVPLLWMDVKKEFRKK
jgi:hypothetical protein